MRYSLHSAVLVLIMIFDSIQAKGEDANSRIVTVGGAVKTNNCVSTVHKTDYTYQEYRLELKTEAKPSNNERAYGEVWFRSFGDSSDVKTSSDLSNSDKVSPSNIDIREAYFQLNGVVLKNLDLKIGRQRIAWGTADKLNPTDNVNPYDLQDLWDFGNHLGSDAIQASFYLGGTLKITGIAIPQFRPAVLPRGAFAAALMPSGTGLPEGVTVQQTNTSVVLPESNAKDSGIAGLKVGGNFLGYDLSLSYLRTRYSLPIIDKIAITPVSNTVFDVDAELVYPRTSIFGADLAGEISSVGIWAEAAVFKPEKVTLKTDMSAMGQGEEKSTALSDDLYTQFVVGGDYTFPRNLYLNSQFVHGMFFQRGKDNLNDYIVMNLEWKVFDEKLKLAPISAVGEVHDWDKIEDNNAVVWTPFVSYYPVDNAEIKIGYHWLDGKDTTVFGALRESDDAYVQMKYSF